METKHVSVLKASKPPKRAAFFSDGLCIQKTPAVCTVGVVARVVRYASFANFSVPSSFVKPQPL